MASISSFFNWALNEQALCFIPDDLTPREKRLIKEIYDRDIGLEQIVEDYPVQLKDNPELLRTCWASISERELALEYKTIVSRNGELLLKLLSDDERKLLRDKLIQFLDQACLLLAQAPRNSVEFTQAYDQFLAETSFKDWEQELVGSKNPFMDTRTREHVEDHHMSHLRSAPTTRRSRELADAEDTLQIIEAHEGFKTGILADLLKKLKRKRIFAAPGKDLHLHYCGKDQHSEARYQMHLKSKENTLDVTLEGLTAPPEKPYFSKKIPSYTSLISNLAQLRRLDQTITSLFRQLEQRHPNDRWEFFQMIKRKCTSYKELLLKFKAAKDIYCAASPELQRYVNSTPEVQKRIRKDYSAAQIFGKFADTKRYIFFESLQEQSCTKEYLIDSEDLEAFISLIESIQHVIYLANLSSKLKNVNDYVDRFDQWEQAKYSHILSIISYQKTVFISNRV